MSFGLFLSISSVQSLPEKPRDILGGTSFVFGQHCKPRDRETLIVITCHEELVSAQPCGHVFIDVCLQQWACTKVRDTKLALTSMPCDLRTTRDA